MKSYYLISLLLLALAAVPFLVRALKDTRHRGRELTVIAVMTALAVIARSVFYMLPQVKPMAAIVILTGISFGGSAGFLTGMLSGFVSNFIFGQGPWTPWQMLGFGLLGALAGWLFQKRTISQTNRILATIYAFFSVLLLYGILLDTSTVLLSGNAPTKAMFLATYASGFVFNLIHAGASAVFLFLFYFPVTKRLERIRTKYGVFFNPKKLSPGSNITDT